VCVTMKGTALGAELAEDNSQLLRSVGNTTLTVGVPSVAGSKCLSAEI
jgi:hypothetical protein